MALHVSSGSGAPATVPVSLGAHYIDTATGDHYVATGIEVVTDWVKQVSVSSYLKVDANGKLQVLNEDDSSWITVRGRNDPDGNPEIYADT